MTFIETTGDTHHECGVYVIGDREMSEESRGERPGEAGRGDRAGPRSRRGGRPGGPVKCLPGCGPGEAGREKAMRPCSFRPSASLAVLGLFVCIMMLSVPIVVVKGKTLLFSSFI